MATLTESVPSPTQPLLKNSRASNYIVSTCSPAPRPPKKSYAPRLFAVVLLYTLICTTLRSLGYVFHAQQRSAVSAVPAMSSRVPSRAWNEPGCPLLTAPQPHTFASQPAGSAQPLLFVGVFSAVTAGRSRRDLYRQTVMSEYPKDVMTVRFILARPSVEWYPPLIRDLVRWRIERAVAQEMRQHGDMVVLDTIDNMDEGKTHSFLQYMAGTYSGREDRPRFVIKADDDTVFAVPNLIAMFRERDWRRNVYWGTSAGADPSLPRYFRGLAYGLSWPLVAWLGSVDLSLSQKSGYEDARTGQWLESLDPVVDPVERVDLGWSMGDWTQVNTTTETVALHWLKQDRWFVEQHARIKKAWLDAGRPYTVAHGVKPADCIAHGEREPGIRRTGVLRFCLKHHIVGACKLIGLEKPWYTAEYKFGTQDSQVVLVDDEQDI